MTISAIKGFCSSTWGNLKSADSQSVALTTPNVFLFKHKTNKCIRCLLGWSKAWLFTRKDRQSGLERQLLVGFSFWPFLSAVGILQEEATGSFRAVLQRFNINLLVFVLLFLFSFIHKFLAFFYFCFVLYVIFTEPNAGQVSPEVAQQYFSRQLI
ncbi:hypothetical protein HAT2_00144 [Candidatus Similichlamydia laticola]|uniref:Uncharacterized protein n=2 Tax=Candidatus Similichlamydia laticola TaxID=2170265 RepID=A0A369KJ27_9BACT|nr:hypothetical protein HAT2_00144 [Candidatus Similichlamydia laticola]